MIKCNEICDFKGENICCSECGDNETCSNICGLECSTCGKTIIADDAGLEKFRDNNYVLFKNIFNICEQKKNLEIEEKKMKEELKKSMELYNIKSFDNDILKMIYILKQVPQLLLIVRNLKKNIQKFIQIVLRYQIKRHI
ncbi:hypothetical protein GSQ33_03000 [Clostridioides difficile]|nr:hypothetical protein [Clostridioides difficile]MCB4302798.1 hypothetical protein [Clostridioides difficile]MCM0744881.1 hypothetical protein [Clostridioides difficile]MCP8332046.1 hypothetical protein [Clostridioides difficile]MCP8338092.1 hypothetical protein [Clostridioides difficile]MCP8385455.1 hypothetical protein [Clostridioides difficile]